MNVNDLVNALDTISNGRVKAGADRPGTNPFVVTKTSHLPGKAVTETPGLVVGNPDGEIKKIAVLMTLTESAIELAGASGVDALVVHHPVADAASSGGVLLKTYLELYNLAVLELHEAFHGLHPGIAYLHGHNAAHVDI
ncbi:MAG: Nif3-like dinuclear metal center hexameric protein, partial [Desulfobacterales bacterium]|nr:Nif3-like dinuclear metal center hexameric protein [Desulfobacterales bacterium]